MHTASLRKTQSAITRSQFGAATGCVKRYPNIRPFLTIPDILAASKMMRAVTIASIL